MSRLPNRRDDEVRRLLDTPHPVVPLDLTARAAARGRRIVRRRRAVRLALWLVLFAAVLAGVVLAAAAWPDHSAHTTPTDGSWWSATG
ncbi:hypothetical protein [Streptomyces sp. CBMA29]|uniref:hypothetical protein n=1 Tax=Streptomyces sp. CBMA29 TaxID=1896314 RepID=UPI001661A79C|nr:hypothetical protein [Streptomyces sp. CBMA29]MBD0735558.1 hypothetical protein [Streptomyces sp. CBMA29]